jgi:hypothetical protein
MIPVRRFLGRYEDIMEVDVFHSQVYASVDDFGL